MSNSNIPDPRQFEDWKDWATRLIQNQASQVVLGAESVETAKLANDAVTNPKLRDSAAASVIGRSANSAGDPGDIAAAANDRLLRRVANVLGFGQLTSGMFPNLVVPNAALQPSVALITTDSFTGTLTGMTDTTQGTVSWLRVGNLMTLWVDFFFQGTSNSNSMEMTGLPAAVLPANDRRISTIVRDNTSDGNFAQASIDVSAALIHFWIGDPLAFAGFTASGLKGLLAGWSITYPL